MDTLGWVAIAGLVIGLVSLWLTIFYGNRSDTLLQAICRHLSVLGKGAPTQPAESQPPQA